MKIKNSKGFTWVVGLGMGDGEVTLSISKPLNVLPPREQTLVTEIVRLMDEYAEEMRGEFFFPGDDYLLREAASKLLDKKTFVGRVKKAWGLLCRELTKSF